MLLKFEVFYVFVRVICVDSVMLLILYLSFVFLLDVVSLIVRPCSLLLLLLL